MTHPHFHLWFNASNDDFFVAEQDDIVLGFVAINGAELVRLYVKSTARGTGTASTLLAFAERQMADNGIYVAKLFCTAGNLRAESFYRREGWQQRETFTDFLWVPEGTEEVISATTCRFEKRLKGENPVS